MGNKGGKNEENRPETTEPVESTEPSVPLEPTEPTTPATLAGDWEIVSSFEVPDTVMANKSDEVARAANINSARAHASDLAFQVMQLEQKNAKLAYRKMHLTRSLGAQGCLRVLQAKTPPPQALRGLSIDCLPGMYEAQWRIHGVRCGGCGYHPCCPCWCRIRVITN